MKLLLTTLLIMLPVTTNAAVKQELKTVDSVDVQKYMGKWYDIADYPAWFQKNCVAVTATYTLMPNGTVKVLNECRKEKLDGKYSSITGKAWVSDKKTNSKLKVRFFWPFSADYWIIDLGKDYEYAVVSEPTRKFLWILCRKPVMDETVYNGIIDRLKKQGFDLTKLQKILQSPE
jgi:apolipoprotein D and lipocalin family protein